MQELLLAGGKGGGGLLKLEVHDDDTIGSDELGGVELTLNLDGAATAGA